MDTNENFKKVIIMYSPEVQELLEEFQSTYKRLKQHEEGLPYPGRPYPPYMPLSKYGYVQDAQKLRTCAENLRELLPEEIRFLDAHINSTYNTREVAYVDNADDNDKRLSQLMHKANEQLYIDFNDVFRVIIHNADEIAN